MDPAGALNIPLDLPYGAKIWKIDAYGYRVTAGTLNWGLIDHDSTTGALNILPPTGTTGTGLHHASVPFTGSQVALGHTLSIELYTTDANAGFVGAVVQYTQPLTNVLVPIAPIRVFDSRWGTAGKIVKGTPRTISVKDAISFANGSVVTPNAIPAGAVAVTYNLTITGTVGSGWVALLPGTSTTVSTSSINWSAPNTTIANGGVLALGVGAAERKITIVAGGGGTTTATHVILDITGYYVSES